jgi:hypothetical protein
MASLSLPIHPGLSAGSRFGVLTTPGARSAVLGWGILLGLGLGTALATLFLRSPIRVPGHVILYTVLPLSLGLALVPRHLAGSVVSGSAFLLVLGFQWAGVPGMGLPAQLSMLLTGPLFDLATLGAKPGWRLYGQLTLAGLLSNLAAYASRPLLGLWGLSGGGGRVGWDVVASFAACGLVAGLVGALCWFRLSPRQPQEEQA